MDKNFDIRSEEVQDILSFVPAWTIRWGITVILIILLGGVFMAWLIKYPDTITGPLTLTTSNPPIKLVNRHEGKLVKINYENKSFVKKGNVIAEVENSLTSTDINNILEVISSAKDLIEKDIPFQQKEIGSTFGNLQEDYNQLIQNINNYSEHYSNEYYKSRLVGLEGKIKNYHDLVYSISNQLHIHEKELKNIKEIYQNNKKLFEENVISRFAFIEIENDYFRNEKQLEETKGKLVNAKINLVDLISLYEKEQYEYSEKKRILGETIFSSILSLKNSVKEWYQIYAIVAPKDGTLHYNRNISLNQFIKSSEEIFTIVPDRNKLVGIIEMDKLGIGKVKPNQKVLIKFDGFPYQEYGQVIGEIESIAEIPNENKYYIYISFPNGLKTSYNRTLEYKPQMMGTAEIITSNKRLLIQIFYSFKKLKDKI